MTTTTRMTEVTGFTGTIASLASLAVSFVNRMIVARRNRKTIFESWRMERFNAA